MLSLTTEAATSTKANTEGAPAYSIPAGDDRRVLIDGCNTAKKVRAIPGAAEQKADYTLIFYHEYSETEDSITVPIWLSGKDERAYLSCDGRYYRLDAATTAKIKELAARIQNGTLYQDFEIIDDGKEDGPAPEKIYSDLKNTYFLSSTRSRHIMIQFGDGTQMDLLKALDTHSVDIDTLMEKGLQLVVKPKE